MKRFLLIAALLLYLDFLSRYVVEQTEALNAGIATLSARVAAIEDSVSRIRPLQASHNALARRVNRLNSQAGRVFGTQQVRGER